MCGRCGATGDVIAALTWTRSVDGGEVTWYCERCSRENVRSIEAKLDEQYW